MDSEQQGTATLSPRAALAARLYASGACKTKGEAAEAAGLSKGYFYVLSSPKNGSERVRSLIEQVDSEIQSKTVDMSKVIELLGRRAVRNIADHMENASSEALRLKAATDLADRSPETQKTQRTIAASFSVDGEDAKALAAAMVESANIQKKYAHVAEGDYIEVNVESGVDHYGQVGERGEQQEEGVPISVGDSGLSQAGSNGLATTEGEQAVRRDSDADREPGQTGNGRLPERQVINARLEKLRKIKAAKASQAA